MTGSISNQQPSTIRGEAQPGVGRLAAGGSVGAYVSDVARPSGTVTFLFTDVEGSTQRWEADAVGADAALAEHDALLAEVIGRYGGYVFARGGDGVAAAFDRASDGVTAAAEAQRALAVQASGGLRVRMGLHTGEAVERDGDYFGPTVNRAARIMAAGHGGQVLMSSVTAGLVSRTDRRDLGMHLLAGIDERVGIVQLVIDGLGDEFPPLRTRHANQTNLPPALTSFIGRDLELDHVVELVDTARLVTLVGPGGAGKTRLALEAGRSLLDRFDGGVWLVGLADVDDPASVALRLAQSIGPHDPFAGAAMSPLDRVTRSIGSARLLALLDNCEHVRDECAALVAHLLESCPYLVVVATSREPLGVAGEQLVEVGSLDLPRADDLQTVAASAAASLFVERARSVRADFALDHENASGVAVLCRRLAGLPLALELAAARTRVLTPAQLVERLDGAFAVLGGTRSAIKHHETLQATLSWSYDLLTTDQQQLLRRLSVFRGGFSLDGAETITHEEQRPRVLDDLASLVDKSVVAVLGEGLDGERRFHLLEVVRDFALQRLDEHDERADAERRHRDNLRRRCSELDANDRGTLPFRLLAAEIDNVRAAIAWSLNDGTGADALDLIATYPCWQDLGLLREQVKNLGAVLDRSTAAPVPLPTLSGALLYCSVNMTYLGDRSGARRANEQLAQLAAAHHDDPAVRGNAAFSLGTYGYLFADTDLATAHTRMSEAQAWWDATGAGDAYPSANQAMATIMFGLEPDGGFDRAVTDGLARAQHGGPVIGITLRVLDCVHRVLRGDHAPIERCARGHAELLTADAGWEGHLLSYFVALALEAVGDTQRAAMTLMGYLQFARSSGLQVLLAGSLRSTARLCAQRQPDAAIRLWAAADRLETATGMRRITAGQDLDADLAARCRRQFDERQVHGLDHDTDAWTVPQVIDAAATQLTET
jgi:predicted ATPase/class 3 adenylate cyclase